MEAIYQYIWIFILAVWDLLREMSPYLLLGFAMAGLLHAFIPSSMIAKYMGGESFGAIVRGALVGVPLPLCSCGVLPVAASARESGAGKGPTMAFLISTPVTGIDSILATAGVLGWVFTLARILASFVMGIAAGVVAKIFPGQSPEPAVECGCDRCEAPEAPPSLGIGARLKTALRYGFVELPETLFNSMAMGLLVGGLISVLLPERLITGYSGSAVVGILIATLIGIPLYVCATGSIPIAAAMMMKGFSPGAALAFLIAGPATNAIAIATVRKILGTRHLVIYLAVIFVGAIGFAFLFDLIPYTLAMGEAMHHHALGHKSIFYYFSAGLLILILGAAKLRPRWAASKIEESNMSDKKNLVMVRVPDMTCSHCEHAISEKLNSLEFVKSATVDLKNKKVAVETKAPVDPQKILEALKAIGYSPELL